MSTLNDALVEYEETANTVDEELRKSQLSDNAEYIARAWAELRAAADKVHTLAGELLTDVETIHTDLGRHVKAADG